MVRLFKTYLFFIVNNKNLCFNVIKISIKIYWCMKLNSFTLLPGLNKYKLTVFDEIYLQVWCRKFIVLQDQIFEYKIQWSIINNLITYYKNIYFSRSESIVYLAKVFISKKLVKTYTIRIRKIFPIFVKFKSTNNI